jgi:hypothetical protein
MKCFRVASVKLWLQSVRGQKIFWSEEVECGGTDKQADWNLHMWLEWIHLLAQRLTTPHSSLRESYLFGFSHIFG